MRQIPDDVAAGTVDDFMYKEGVKDILEKLDYDLIGLTPVKQRVREIASLLVVDKMRLKLGLETSVPSLHMGFTGAAGRDLAPFSDPSRKPLGPFLQARPAPARRRSRCAWARSCSGWATAARGTWSSRRATTWWGSTWATRRPRPGRRSGGRGHVHDTSETWSRRRQRPRRWSKRRWAACCPSWGRRSLVCRLALERTRTPLYWLTVFVCIHEMLRKLTAVCSRSRHSARRRGVLPVQRRQRPRLRARVGRDLMSN